MSYAFYDKKTSSQCWFETLDEAIAGALAYVKSGGEDRPIYVDGVETLVVTPYKIHRLSLAKSWPTRYVHAAGMWL